MKRWMLTGFTMLTMLLLVASPAAAKPADHEGPRDSGAAEQCQKGKWATLARTDVDTAFVSQDACVSYGAQGGTIVPYVALTPTVTLTWAPYYATETATYCLAIVTVTNFPDGTYDVYVSSSSRPLGNQITVSGGIGSVSSGGVNRSFYPTHPEGDSTHTRTATVNGVSSAPSKVAC
jgi:hypothetical protein